MSFIKHYIIKFLIVIIGTILIYFISNFIIDLWITLLESYVYSVHSSSLPYFQESISKIIQYGFDGVIFILKVIKLGTLEASLFINIYYNCFRKNINFI